VSEEFTYEQLDTANGHLADMVKHDAETIARLKADLAEACRSEAEAVTRLQEVYDLNADLRHELASRPPAPAWTSEPPKEEGWYWVTQKANGEDAVVWLEPDMDDEVWGFFGRYAGPIPEPPA
jgi:hypothetical protein